MTAERFALAGLGVTRQGRHEGRSDIDLKGEALGLALDDCGLALSDVDGLVYVPGMMDLTAYGHGGEVVRRLALGPDFVWQIQGGGTSAVAAIAIACGAIAQGHAKYVAVVYGDNALTGGVRVGLAGQLGGDERDSAGAYGMYSPGADHALAIRRHMHVYGTAKEQLGAVALTAREYAGRRPDAFLHDRPLSLDDYMDARPVAEPLGKLDYCLVTDGGSAFMVTTTERARALRRPPVLIGGIGLSMAMDEVYDGTQYERSGARRACERSLRAAGIGRDEVDLAQIYDCFTPTVLLTLEACGFCKPGESGPFAADGHLRLGGRLPTNTAGGELAWGYQQGFTPVIEGVRQLRGEGGATQVQGATVCLATGHGGMMASYGQLDYLEASLVLRRDA